MRLESLPVPAQLLLVRWKAALAADISGAEETGGAPVEAQTFVQNVDTVRLVCADGSVVSAVDLAEQAGGSLLTFSQVQSARHKGELVDGGVAFEH